MIVFKTFLKVINKCKSIIILYTVMLIAFGAFNMKTSDNSTNFVASKPDILIINEDNNNTITKNLINYLEKYSNFKNIKNNDDAINDALFYRDVNYTIYIPKNYGSDFSNGLNPEIKIKSTNDYQASYASMILNRYIKVANIYQSYFTDENEMIEKINETLNENNLKVEMTTKLDTDNISKAAFFYNFANYSILSGCIYVICLILSSFKKEQIRKRTIISSMDYKKYNRYLLLCNSLFAIALWIFYVLLSFILIGNVMFSPHGLIMILNSFLFVLCALTIAFLIGNLLNNKNAINGIVNVIALGSSFLCGAFVPMQWLPDFVLKIAHILPSYWYIRTNELVKSIETLNFESLKPIVINMSAIIIFSIIFIIITNIISNRKRKID